MTKRIWSNTIKGVWNGKYQILNKIKKIEIKFNELKSSLLKKLMK